ncbi:MAG: ATPase [Oscillospiraceae bacterium]|nr:ATPase [Oscillospiraceae bacterium]
MAVSEIRVISIIGIMSSLDFVVRACGESCSFHPDDALSFYTGHEEIKNFLPVTEKNPFSEPLKILKDLAKSVDFPLRIVDLESDIEKEDIEEFVNYSIENLGNLLKIKREISKNISNCEKSLARISHFVGKDIDLGEINACCYLKSRFGRISKENFKKTENNFDNPYILFFPLTSDENYFWGVYFCPIENLEEIDGIFSSLGFEELDILGICGTPEQKIEKINKQIKEYKVRFHKVNREISHFLEINQDRFLKFYTRLLEFKEYFDIKNHVFRYNNSFILVGWVLADKADALKEKLQDIQGVESEVENPQEAIGHDPPVKLSNNLIFRPFEIFTQMYGVPDYDGFDPTPLLAVTYTVIFGIMFGDVGQGLVLAIAGYFICRLKKIDAGKILIFCGAFSMIFGFVYGSFFGFEHALDPVYEKFFDMHEKPIEVMLPENINKMLIYSISIGCVLIPMAMCINIFCCLKRNRLIDAVLGRNGLSGLIFYLSIVSLVISHQMKMSLGLFLPLYIFFLIICPLACIFLKKPLGNWIFDRENVIEIDWGEYLIENTIELLFETILGFVSNTLSFLRIGVFVLVHAGMMSVVFGLAQMCGGLGYCLIVVLGNVLVMVLEALLVGIQVMRLELYELFSRFFNEHGPEFKPVSIGTG